MGTDLVSPELRAVEREIDSAYLKNPLVKLAFGEAAWYFLAFCEERLILPYAPNQDGGETKNQNAQIALADEVINHAKWPLRWLKKSCRTGGAIPDEFNDRMYQASRDLSKLASEYLSFESAFTYASLGLMTLNLEGDRIVPSSTFREDTRYEAYDRLTDLDGKVDTPVLDLIAELVRDDVRVDGDQFSYPLNPTVVQETLRRAEPGLSRRFRVPSDWNLAGYSLREFATVSKCLWAISIIHFVSRLVAADLGCVGRGYSKALVVMGKDDLIRRINQYTGMAEERIQVLIADLTYGRGSIQSPDLALQPLVNLTDTEVGWAPCLYLNIAVERNLLVLLNRSATSRREYSRVSQQKEQILRSRLMRELRGMGFRFWDGDVTGWSESLDIDLAIISESEKHCLVLELKSFLAPAEPREIRDRSTEIARGVQQIGTRRNCANRQPSELCENLQISADYCISWGVVSETSIGAGWAQDQSVPVVRAAHLVRQLLEARQLRPVCEWLTTRQYLPNEDVNYEVVDIHVQIERWSLDWYGIRGLP